MKQNNAYIIDPYSHGSYHEVINQSYLMMLCSLYETVTYIGNKSSCENLKILLNKCNFDYSNVTFIEKRFPKIKTGYAGFDYLMLILFVGFFDYYYYIKSPKCHDVFYNNNIYQAISLIKYFSFWKSNRIFAMCHSEMEHINKNKNDSLCIKILSWYLRFVFVKHKISKKIHFILLSDDMVIYFRKNIREENFTQIHSMDHAYIRPENDFKETFKKSSILKIGVPGAISEDRGLSTLRKILTNLSNDKIHIYALSYVEGNIENKQFTRLNTTGELSSFEEYNANVQRMDVLLFLYEKGSYQLTASGAVLEAIWNNKPIIALDNCYFKYLFEKFGKIGFLCNSIDELTYIINTIELSKIDNSMYDNIIRARDLLKPYNVTHQLSTIINS